MTKIALQGRNLIYLKVDGTLAGCGSNSENVFATGILNAFYLTPQIIATSVTDFSFERGLAFVKSDGSLWVTGGAILEGYGSYFAKHDGPLKLPGLFPGASLTMHNGDSLAILVGETLYACGSNINQFALTTGKVIPSAPELIRSDVISADVSSGLFTVTSDGNLWISGPKTFIGKSITGPNVSTSPEVIATNVRQVMAVEHNAFFVKNDGTLWGFGLNNEAMISVPAYWPQTTPVLITTNVRKLCPGYQNLVYIKTDNSLWIAGTNYDGQHGFGSYESRVGSFQVATNVVDAAVGHHLMFVKSDGTVWGAGRSAGGVFTPNGYADVDGLVPVMVMSGAKAVACTDTSSLVLKTNGDLIEFGVSVMPPLDGAYSSKTVATSVVSVSAHSHGFAFVKSDGSAWRGGMGYDGGSGLKEPIYEISPVKALATGVSSVVSRYGVTLFLKGPLISDTFSPVPVPPTTTPTPPPTPPTTPSTPPPSATGRPINLSVRGAAGQGDQTLIAGFTISGSESKTVLIRVSGPGLAPFLSGYVANPTLKIYNASNTVVASNDDWDVALKNDFTSVGAFAWTDGSKDAAVKVSLPPGGYTIHVGNTGAKAESLIEVYDFGKETGSKLSNVSCRVLENPDDPVIMGVTLDKSANLLARNGGPSLKILGVSTAADDTHLVAFNGDKSELARNDDFDPSLSSTFSQAGAYSYGPSGKDAALLLNAAPTSFTLHCTSKGGSGVGLCEVYLLE